MTLQDHIHQLAREHLRTGPDGKAHKVPALLEELRNAVTPGNSGSAGGASGPPIPINAEAVDMLNKIESDMKRDWSEMTGTHWTGSLVELLRTLTLMAAAAEWHAYLERVTLEYIDQITAFLWPVKPRRKLTGKTCPACGQSLYGEERKVALSLGCWDADGNLAKIGDWDIECAGCEAQWSGDQVSWLLRALDAPVVELTAAG